MKIVDSLKNFAVSVIRWFDSSSGGPTEEELQSKDKKIDLLKTLPFFGMHAMCLFAFWTGVNWVAFGTCIFLYFIRMFAITGFYHRYFSHRSFKTSRAAQFIFGVIGNSAVQRGPLWWASHHRDHHLHSDQEDDVHSPRQHGFYWSHMGWFTSPMNFPTKSKVIPDLMRFPELRFLDRFDTLMPILLGFGTFFWGGFLEKNYPQLGTNGFQMLIWGFFISTVLLAHGTFTINSLSHVFGNQRYKTKDDSRNNFFLALITLGEGWHNNHHHYMASARQGFFWWEIDITYYMLKTMSWLGIIWDLNPVPEKFKTATYHKEKQKAHSH